MAMKEKKPRVSMLTPVGRFSFPYLTVPDQGRTYSDDKYKTDFLIDKETFKKEGKGLVDAVMQVGKDQFGSQFSLKGSWRSPFMDTDKMDKADEKIKGCILIRAKTASVVKNPNTKPPLIVGPDFGPDGKPRILTPDEVRNIKGGDWGRIKVTVAAYTQKEGGVTFYLDLVQYWKSGDALGSGNARILEGVEEMEVTMADVAETEDNNIPY